MTWLDEVREFFRQKYPTLPDPFDPAYAYQAGRGRGYARTALEAEIERVTSAQNGTRNHTLNRAAFSLGQLVAGGELDEQLVVTELTTAAHLVGLAGHEIERTIRSGMSAGAKTPRTPPVRTGPLPVGGQTWTGHDQEKQPGQEDGQPGQSATDWVREYLPRLDWYALYAAEDDEEWIVEPILPARRLVALYSAPKIGKSLLMLELAVAIARGESTLGITPDRARHVLYIDFENDPRSDIRARLIAMGYGPEHLDGLVYLSFPQLSALDCEQGGAQLMAAVEVYGSEVVVIDTVSRAIRGEENENDTWLNFYRHTGRQLKAAGVALIRLDHTGKDETRGQRGGSAKSGDVDAVWRMSKVTETMFRLDCEAHRMPVIEKTLVLHRETVPRLRHRVDAEGRSAAWRAKVAQAIEVLDGAGLEPDAGRDRAREALKKAGFKIGTEVLAEAVRRRKALMNMSVEPVRGGSGQVPNEDLSEPLSGQPRTDSDT